MSYTRKLDPADVIARYQAGQRVADIAHIYGNVTQDAVHKLLHRYKVPRRTGGRPRKDAKRPALPAEFLTPRPHQPVAHVLPRRDPSVPLDHLQMNARIDELSERFAQFLTDDQLRTFYALDYRSRLSALRWLERCIRHLPAEPLNYVAELGSVDLYCACGQRKNDRRAKQCKACYEAARSHAATCADCGQPATRKRCTACQAEYSHRTGKVRYWKRKRERAA